MLLVLSVPASVCAFVGQVSRVPLPSLSTWLLAFCDVPILPRVKQAPRSWKASWGAALYIWCSLDLPWRAGRGLKCSAGVDFQVMAVVDCPVVVPGGRRSTGPGGSLLVVVAGSGLLPGAKGPKEGDGGDVSPQGQRLVSRRRRRRAAGQRVMQISARLVRPGPRAHADHGLRCWLLELIGAAPSPAALPVLGAQLGSNDESLRDRAVAGLKKLDTPKHGPCSGAPEQTAQSPS